MATAIPIAQSEYDLERMSLPLLKSTLQTCDVVFAVVALVLLIPGLVVVLYRGWNYFVGSEESEGGSYGECRVVGEDGGEGVGLLGGFAKGGDVVKQMGDGSGNGNDRRMVGDSKMVFKEQEEV